MTFVPAWNLKPSSSAPPTGFTATPAARSPWNHERLHGRVINGLLGHAVEAAFGDPDFLPARLTTDLYRLPPYAPITIETRMVREGARIRVADAEFFAGGVSAARATCQFLRRGQPPSGKVWTPAPWNAPDPEGLPEPEPGARGPIGDNRPVPGEEGGPRKRWFRETHALIAGEAMTPFARVAMSADLASGIANGAMSGIEYINSDVSLNLHRLPAGEWIGFEAIDHGAAEGVATGVVRLHDLQGRFGSVSVCGLAQVLRG